ncbi:MAG: hypothetical protein EBS05_11580 [Proteobacteria bacterium]|nr:hypothetical protein [Pseudomonadota bacterium]
MIDHSYIQRYWRETDSGFPEPYLGDVIGWASWMQHNDNVVSTTRVADPDNPDSDRLVSTVFVGIAPHPTQRPPLLYETLVFNDNTVLARRLSATRSEAEEAHNNLVVNLSSLQ